MKTATVEVLTAEVRVLMVGKRQVTLSVYRQLDVVPPAKITPFGRVRDPKEDTLLDLGNGLYADRVTVVGAGPAGELCRSVYAQPNRARFQDFIRRQNTIVNGRYHEDSKDRALQAIELAQEGIETLHEWPGHDWHELPLIVLAGLT